MDFISVEQEIASLSSKLLELSEKYYEVRCEYGRVKKELYIMLVPVQKIPRYQKMAVDKQLLTLIDENEELSEPLTILYQNYILLEQQYKGLEKLIGAYETKISTLQSLMRWQRDNT